MLRFSLSRLGFVFLGALLTACAGGPAEQGEPEGLAVAEVEPVASEEVPLDLWWDQLAALCGNAYAGELVSNDEADADLAGEPMVMHVRRCEENRLEVPFHIGENRSRTWVLTRPESGAETGLHLQHDHRHEDGSEDVVTLYGGVTEEPGSETVQLFPVDDYSIQLFEREGLSASVVNVWSMELIPGERFSYILRRPNRHFQVDFDLSETIDPPPAPWGHE